MASPPRGNRLQSAVPLRRQAQDEPQEQLRKRRTRAAVACQLCRARKTRCDNRRPSCGYCAMHAVVCIYPDDEPASHIADPHHNVEVSNRAILDKVNQAVSLLREIGGRDFRHSASLPSSAPNLNKLESHAREQNHDQDMGPAESAFADGGFGQLDIPDTAAYESSCEALLTWQSVQSLGIGRHPRSLGLEATVIGCGGQGGSRSESMPQDGLLGLCQRFLTLIHIKNPILDVSAFTKYARHAAEYGPGWDAGACLVLLACALACVATPYDPNMAPVGQGGLSAVQEEDATSGEAYFAAAQRRLGLLPSSLIAVQCQYLAGLYSKFVLRPMGAWTLLQGACTQLQGLLYAKRLVLDLSQDAQGNNSRTRHLEQRLYWSCVKAECELRIELQLPFTGRFKYPDLFPSLSFPSSSELQPLTMAVSTDVSHPGLSPWSPAAWQSSPEGTGHTLGSDSVLQPEEERSWLYYLAEISLRSLMNRTLKGLYAGRLESWAQAGATLERRQSAYVEELDQWQGALPSQLSFVNPLSTRPEIDVFAKPDNELAFFLQTRSTGVLEWIYRPSLYLVLHNKDSLDHANSSRVRHYAGRAVDACVALIRLVALHHRHGGIWGLVRRSFGAALMIAAVAVRHARIADTICDPEHRDMTLAPPSDWVEMIELSLATIRYWSRPDTSDLIKMVNVLETALKTAVGEARAG